MLHAGAYRQNPHGALDLLLAGMADARIHVVGIVDPGAYERLVRARPEVRDAFDVVRVAPMDEARSLALAARKTSLTEAAVLREALALGRHFLGDAALPGSLLSLLETMRRRRPGDDALTMEDVLGTITERSGLPASLLDERERLDVDALRVFFGDARDRPAGGRRVHGRARRAAQGGPDRSHAAAGRAALRRADRHRQDGDREGAGRAPLRLRATG